MKIEQIEWISKQGILSSLRTQLEQLLNRKHLCNEQDKGRIYQLKLIIEEIERT